MGYQFAPRYIVVCKDDKEPYGTGKYVLATRGYWTDEAAAEKYAKGIAASRQPIVVRSDAPLEFYDKIVHGSRG